MTYDRMHGVSQSTRRVEVPAMVGGVAVLLVLLAGGSAEAMQATDQERVTIQGRVVDEVTRVPLAGVEVSFEPLGLRVQTDSNGQFEVKGLRKGVYELVLSLAGYQRTSGDFTVLNEGSFVTSMIPLNAAGALSSGRFVGRITDGESGKALGSVDVQIAAVFMGGVTNDAGRFDMPAVPPGRYAVGFSSLGYATRIDTVEIVSGQTSDVKVRLSLDPLDIEPIEVVVEPREMILEDVGFYQRRTDGFGKFIDRAVIEARNPYEMTDLFVGINGVFLVQDPYSGMEQNIVLRGGRLGRGLRGGGHCYPQVVVDGLIVHRGGEFPAHIDQLVDTDAVAGIEIFPSSIGVPTQYGGVDAACGVIVIWTRR